MISQSVSSLRKHPFLPALRAGDVSRGRTSSATQTQKFRTDDVNQCLYNKSGSHGSILRVFWSMLVKCCVHLPTSSSKTQMLLQEKTIFHKYWLFCLTFFAFTFDLCGRLSFVCNS